MEKRWARRGSDFILLDRDQRLNAASVQLPNPTPNGAAAPGASPSDRALAIARARARMRRTAGPAPAAPPPRAAPPRTHSRARRALACRAQAAPPPEGAPSLFVFGLGYSGLAAARHFGARGWAVGGTVRSEAAAAALRAAGVDAHAFDASAGAPLGAAAAAALRAARAVLSTAPPDGSLDDPVAAAARAVLAAAATTERPPWVGYISSTSVYGGHAGAWVGEAAAPRAPQGKALARLRAEAVWRGLAPAAHVFRCGGIYGPRRSALEAAAAEATAAVAGGAAAALPSKARRGRQRHTARIHVLDICRALEASIHAPRPGAIYNLADDDPAPRRAAVAFAAALLAGAAPAAAAAAAGAEAEAAAAGAFLDSAGLDEKRVSNALVKAELGLALAFPSYREGLAALAAGDARPFAPGDV
jgi:nucleoside-diphosphate-sugar epimerase